MSWLRSIWRRYREDETVLVTRGPRAGLGLALHAVATFVVGLSALVAIQLPDHPRLHLPASIVIGGLVGWTAQGRHRRARAYWGGWIKGRTAMVASLHEAERRGMNLHDWLTAEFQRDRAIIGLPEDESEKDDPRNHR